MQQLSRRANSLAHLDSKSQSPFLAGGGQKKNGAGGGWLADFEAGLGGGLGVVAHMR